MDSTTGNNPTNNPRLDLLHNSGDNQQLKGAAGSYTPDASRAQVFHASAPAPAAPVPPRSVPAAPQVAAAPEASAAPPAPRPAPVTPSPEHSDAAPKSANIVLRAVIIIVVLLLVAAAGVGGWWYMNKQTATKTETPTAPAKPKAAAIVPVAVNGLVQEADGATIVSGTTTKSNDLTFRFTLPTSATTGSVTPEIELRAAGTDFTGEPTTIGQAVDATGKDLSLSLDVNDLIDGAYHWQVRAVTDEKQGAWVVFGDDPTASSFTIASAAAAETPAPIPPPAAAPAPAPAPTPTPAPAPAPAPPPAAQPQALAPTGDSTLPRSLAALGVMAVAAGGWLWTRRRYAQG